MRFTEIAQSQGKILIPLVGSIDAVVDSVRARNFLGAEAEHRYHVRGIEMPPHLSVSSEAEHELYIGRCSVGLLYDSLDRSAVDAALSVKGPATAYVPGSDEAAAYVRAQQFMYTVLSAVLKDDLSVDPYSIAGKSFVDGKWQPWTNDSWKRYVAEVAPRLSGRAQRGTHAYEQIVRFPLSERRVEDEIVSSVGRHYDRHCTLAWLGFGPRFDGDAQIHADRTGVLAAFNPANEPECNAMLFALYDHLNLPDRVRIEKRIAA